MSITIVRQHKQRLVVFALAQFGDVVAAFLADGALLLRPLRWRERRQPGRIQWARRPNRLPSITESQQLRCLIERSAHGLFCSRDVGANRAVIRRAHNLDDFASLICN
jgi:hypothetical protein